MAIWRFFRAKWGLGNWLMIGVLLGACGYSPQHDLSRARMAFAQLQQSDASEYIPTEMHAIRRLLNRAEAQIRTNRFVAAEQDIREALNRVQRAFVHYHQKKAHAEKQSTEFLMFLNTELRALRTGARGLPRRTYVDQNRYDIVRSRLNTLNKQYAALKAYFNKNQYLTILKEAPAIKKQLLLVHAVMEPPDSKRFVVNKIEDDAFEASMQASSAK